MIKKYKNCSNHEIEEAIIFEYSNRGIKETRDFCGLAFVSAEKHRHMGAIGEATLFINGLKSIAFEGDYIAKSLKGDLIIMSREYFISVYEEIK
jgi:hypothetical protein